MSQNNQPYTPVFDWAIVELFGHQRIIGQIGEQQIGGETFIRVDVPEVGDTPAFTKLYGKGAIYAMTPVTEGLAREALEAMKPVPVNPYDLNLHRLPAPSRVIDFGDEDDDGDEDAIPGDDDLLGL